jgi:hypothetical protein
VTVALTLNRYSHVAMAVDQEAATPANGSWGTRPLAGLGQCVDQLSGLGGSPTETIDLGSTSGGMAERLIAAVLKTAGAARLPGVRIPVPPPNLPLCPILGW